MLPEMVCGIDEKEGIRMTYKIEIDDVERTFVCFGSLRIRVCKDTYVRYGQR